MFVIIINKTELIGSLIFEQQKSNSNEFMQKVNQNILFEKY